MVIVYFCIPPQYLWINISFDEDTVENIIPGTIWDLAVKATHRTVPAQHNTRHKANVRQTNGR
jgi:hypothetical protein